MKSVRREKTTSQFSQGHETCVKIGVYLNKSMLSLLYSLNTSEMIFEIQFVDNEILIYILMCFYFFVEGRSRLFSSQNRFDSGKSKLFVIVGNDRKFFLNIF